MRPDRGTGKHFAVSDSAEPGWRAFHAVYDRLASPLTPAAADVEIVRSALGGRDDRVLLLGVTPALANLGRSLVAVDNSPQMVAAVWPGDRDGRVAMLADWTALPFEDGAFDAVIGDGALNSAPHQMRDVIREAARVLRPGGCAIFRAFCAPEEPESLGAISGDATNPRFDNFHALKWRIAMALASDHADAIVPVRAIRSALDAAFPDRDALAAATGWPRADIDTIDAYEHAGHSLAFPTLGHLLALGGGGFAAVEVRQCASYPLAERCPTIVWTK